MAWNVNNLYNDLKRLKTLYNKETNPRIKYELSDYIYCLEDIISGFLFDNKTRVVGQGMYFKALESIPRYRVYLPFIYDFISILDNHTVESPEMIYDKNVEYNKKDMFELSREFYKQVGGKFYEAYKEFDREKAHRINYCNFDSNDSTTYYIPGLNKYYVNLGAKGTDRDIIETFIHEAGHIVTAKINNRRYNSTDIFVEIETLFFEIIADDFLAKKTNDSFFKSLEKEKVDIHYNKGSILDTFFIAYDSVISNAKDVDNPNKLFNDICHDYNLKQYKDVNIDTLMKYTFSYICAVELAEIYREDKDKALQLLTNIITENRGITEYEKIINNINPCEHVDNYIKRLKKEK